MDFRLARPQQSGFTDEVIVWAIVTSVTSSRGGCMDRVRNPPKDGFTTAPNRCHGLQLSL